MLMLIVTKVATANPACKKLRKSEIEKIDFFFLIGLNRFSICMLKPIQFHYNLPNSFIKDKLTKFLYVCYSLIDYIHLRIYINRNLLFIINLFFKRF